MHEMELVRAYPTGAEHWRCPICGREFVIAWPPEYKKITLVEGDPYAMHNVSKGGVQVNADAQDAPLVDAFRDFLNQLGEQ